MSEEQRKPAGRPKPEVRGKVIAVMDEWRNNAGTFWKREVVVETGLRYPNPLKVTFKKDDAELLEGVAEGDRVIIPYVLDGREYEGRYYVDVVGTGLQRARAARRSPSSDARRRPPSRRGGGATAATRPRSPRSARR